MALLCRAPSTRHPVTVNNSIAAAGLLETVVTHFFNLSVFCHFEMVQYAKCLEPPPSGTVAHDLNTINKALNEIKQELERLDTFVARERCSCHVG